MRYALLMMAMLAFAPAAKAAYKETMDPNGPTKNMKTDFGMVDDDAKSNLSFCGCLSEVQRPQRLGNTS